MLEHRSALKLAWIADRSTVMANHSGYHHLDCDLALMGVLDGGAIHQRLATYRVAGVIHDPQIGAAEHMHRVVPPIVGWKRVAID